MKSLGNISSGLGGADGGAETMNRLVYAFTQVQATGRLMGTEVRQITETGFPLFTAITRNTGETVAELQKRIKDGQVGFNEFSKAILDAGKQGGIFAGQMELMSGTITGKLSILRDTVFFAMAGIGNSISGTFKDIIGSTTKVVDALFGTEDAISKTMLVLSNLFKGFATWYALSKAQAVITGIATTAQAAYNAVVAVGTAFTMARTGALDLSILADGRDAIAKTGAATATEALNILRAKEVVALELLTLAKEKETLALAGSNLAKQADAKASVAVAEGNAAVATSSLTAATAVRTLTLAFGVIAIAVTAGMIAYQLFNRDKKGKCSEWR
jgi:tape measure domain-containing protein